MTTIYGIVGLLIISTSIWIKKEIRQDYLFILGGIALLKYSIDKGDVIFIILQVVFVISALLEILKMRK